MMQRAAIVSEQLEALARILDISLDASTNPPEPAAPFEAGYLEICRNPDGSAEIWLDDNMPFHLPRSLTEFLEHLASAKIAPDGLPAWISRLALREWLECETGRPHDSKQVNHLVYMLRKRIREAGVKRHVIHTDPRRGVRFALRNGPSGLVVRGSQRPVIAGD